MSENIFFDTSRLRRRGANSIIGKTVRIRHPEKVSIGDNVIIDDFTYISGDVTVGDYVHIGPGCVLSASSAKVTMGPLSGLSAGCKVYAGSSSYVNCGLDMPTIPEQYRFNVIHEDVTFEPFALVGAAGIILPGCHLPQGFAVSAALTVRKKLSLKPWHLLTDEEGSQLRRRGVAELARRVNAFYKIEVAHA